MKRREGERVKNEGQSRRKERENGKKSSRAKRKCEMGRVKEECRN